MNCYEKAKKIIENAENVKPKSMCCYGPTGPSNTNSLGGIQLQLVGSNYLLLNPSEPFIFNTLLNQDSSNISYNMTTGEFTFSENKNYFVFWWVIVDGTGGTTNVSVSFTNGVETISSLSPLVTGQFSGSAFISVNNSPEVWRLLNTTVDEIGLGSQFIKANILIMESF